MPACLAITPKPGEKISIRGIINRKLITTELPSTQYITCRAPNLSDSQPPAARITPEGRLNMDAKIPAKTNETWYTFTQ
ncbi:hypothetical protein D3C72_867270 [compost metagenome]